MKISEVVNLLNELKDEHGDIDVVLCDADTGWDFELNKINFNKYPRNQYIEIAISYTGPAYKP